jgi:hypothetical protein
MKKSDLMCKKFDRLRVVGDMPSDKIGNSRWLCHCVCGEDVCVRGSHLMSGNTRSCGCLHSETARNLHTNHSHRGPKPSPTYRTWEGMKRRCLSPRASNYKYYGGRGIRVCDRWLKFELFLLDMGVRPTGMSIDRVHVNGDYEPGNCKWSSQLDQVRNRRCSPTVSP